MNTCEICDKLCKNRACSSKCGSILAGQISKEKWKNYSQPKKECLNCKKLTTNHKFCSRNCSATYSNRNPTNKIINNRKKKNKICFEINCNNLIYNDRKRCKQCNDKLKHDIMNQTMKECMIHTCQRSGVFAGIRDFARRYYLKSERCKCCAVCGYDKHFEVCHIKPISSYDEDVKISTINDPTNLVALCKNCHWELDRGEISKEKINEIVGLQLDQLI